MLCPYNDRLYSLQHFPKSDYRNVQYPDPQVRAGVDTTPHRVQDTPNLYHTISLLESNMVKESG